MTPTEPERVPCPFCAELILPQATVCRYCDHPTGFITSPQPHPNVADPATLAAGTPPPPQPMAEAGQRVEGRKTSAGMVIGIIVGVAVLALILLGIYGFATSMGTSAEVTCESVGQEAVKVSVDNDAQPRLLALDNGQVTLNKLDDIPATDGQYFLCEGDGVWSSGGESPMRWGYEMTNGQSYVFYEPIG